MNQVYLSRRNLVTLLNKLDRPESKRSIIKFDTVHREYPCTVATMITAVEDANYYTDRDPGVVHPKDLPVLTPRSKDDA
jgi:hypothetical protein